jgi:hypothetical protein
MPPVSEFLEHLANGFPGHFLRSRSHRVRQCSCGTAAKAGALTSARDCRMPLAPSWSRRDALSAQGRNRVPKGKRASSGSARVKRRRWQADCRGQLNSANNRTAGAMLTQPWFETVLVTKTAEK